MIYSKTSKERSNDNKCKIDIKSISTVSVVSHHFLCFVLLLKLACNIYHISKQVKKRTRLGVNDWIDSIFSIHNVLTHGYTSDDDMIILLEFTYQRTSKISLEINVIQCLFQIPESGFG